MAKTKTRKILPKQIAGVKLPKKFRRRANRALVHPLARKAVSGALMALAGALVAREAEPGSITRKAAKDAEIRLTSGADAIAHLAAGAIHKVAGDVAGLLGSKRKKARSVKADPKDTSDTDDDRAH